MHRTVPLLCLAIALAGPLLTHAEAASDLARSLAELLDGRGIESPDGGIGDDPVVASTSKPCPSSDLSWAEEPALDGLTPLFILAPPPSGAGAARRRRRGGTWPSATARKRHAWLQLFRC
jgi:hypothetical protein